MSQEDRAHDAARDNKADRDLADAEPRVRDRVENGPTDQNHPDPALNRPAGDRPANEAGPGNTPDSAGEHRRDNTA